MTQIVLTPTWENVGPFMLEGNVKVKFTVTKRDQEKSMERDVAIFFKREGGKATLCVGSVLVVGNPDVLAALHGKTPVIDGVHGSEFRQPRGTDRQIVADRFSTASCNAIFESVGQKEWKDVYRDSHGAPVVERPAAIVEEEDAETGSQDEALRTEETPGESAGDI